MKRYQQTVIETGMDGAGNWPDGIEHWSYNCKVSIPIPTIQLIPRLYIPVYGHRFKFDPNRSTGYHLSGTFFQTISIQSNF